MKNKMLVLFKMLLKRYVKSKSFIALLLLMPLMVIASMGILKVNSAQRSKEVVIGVVCTDEDELSNKTAQALTRADYSLKFVWVDNIDELKNKVLSNELEHGIVFKEQLKEKLDKRSDEKLITYIIDDENVITTMSKEIVFAEMFRAYGGDIAFNFLENIREENTDSYNNYEDDYQKQRIKTAYEKYLDEDRVFDVKMHWTKGDGISEDYKESLNLPVITIVSVAMLVVAFYGALIWLTERNTGLGLVVPVRKQLIARVIYIIAPVLLVFVSCVMTYALYLVCLWNTAACEINIYSDLLKMLINAVISIVAASVTSTFVKNEVLMAGIIPVAVVLGIIFMH